MRRMPPISSSVLARSVLVASYHDPTMYVRYEMHFLTFKLYISDMLKARKYVVIQGKHDFFFSAF